MPDNKPKNPLIKGKFIPFKRKVSTTPGANTPGITPAPDNGFGRLKEAEQRDEEDAIISQYNKDYGDNVTRTPKKIDPKTYVPPPIYTSDNANDNLQPEVVNRMRNTVQDINNSTIDYTGLGKEKAKINSVLEQYKDKNFVQRIITPEKFPILNLDDGDYATHKMAWSDDGAGDFYVYPTIVYDEKSKGLIQLDDREAEEYAKKTDQLIHFKSAEEADWFSQHYKDVWNKIGEVPYGITKISTTKEAPGIYGKLFGEQLPTEEVDKGFIKKLGDVFSAPGHKMNEAYEDIKAGNYTKAGINATLSLINTVVSPFGAADVIIKEVPYFGNAISELMNAPGKATDQLMQMLRAGINKTIELSTGKKPETNETEAALDELTNTLAQFVTYGKLGKAMFGKESLKSFEDYTKKYGPGEFNPEAAREYMDQNKKFGNQSTQFTDKRPIQGPENITPEYIKEKFAAAEEKATEIINENKSGTGENSSIPIIITNKSRKLLNELGYNKEDIAQLKPQDAIDIINNKTKKVIEKAPDKETTPAAEENPEVKILKKNENPFYDASKKKTEGSIFNKTKEKAEVIPEYKDVTLEQKKNALRENGMTVDGLKDDNYVNKRYAEIRSTLENSKTPAEALEKMNYVMKNLKDDDIPKYHKKLTDLFVPKKQTAPIEKSDIIIKNVPIRDIATDESRFQNRAGLSKEKVSAIAENYDPQEFDPITVWHDPVKDKDFVLSGHHRIDAKKELGHDSIPTRYFKGTEAEAKNYALNSNSRNAPTKLIERAKYYSDLLKDGKDIKEVEKLARQQELSNANTILNLSALDPNGKTFRTYKQFESSSAENSAKVKIAADWIGKSRREFPELTKAHETEMFDYLLNDNNRKEFKNRTKFLDRVERSVKRLDYNPEEPLNLKNKIAKSPEEMNWDGELTRLQNEKRSYKNEMFDREQALRQAGKLDEEFSSDKTIQDLKALTNLTEKEIGQLYKKRGEFANQEELFGMFDNEVKSDTAQLADFIVGKKKTIQALEQAAEELKRRKAKIAENEPYVGNIDKVRKDIKRGVDSIMSRLDLEMKKGDLDKYDHTAIKMFLDRINPAMLEDVGLSIYKHGDSQGQFDFLNSIVTIFRDNLHKETGFERTAIHEIWHSLSRYLPDSYIKKVNKLYEAERDLYIKKVKKISDALNVKGFLPERTNEWTANNYRYKNIDEWFVETMTDKSQELIQSDLIRRYGTIPERVIEFGKDIFRSMITAVQNTFGIKTAANIFENFIRDKFTEKQARFSLERRRDFNRDYYGYGDDIYKLEEIQPEQDFLDRAAAIPKKNLLDKLKDIGQLEFKEGWDKTRDNVMGAITRAKAITSATIDAYSHLPKFDNFKQVLGEWQGANTITNYAVKHIQKNLDNLKLSKIERVGITNFIQADGNFDLLRERANKSTGRIKEGYETAANLSPEAQALARTIGKYFEEKLQQGIDLDMLDSQIENYVNQIWKKKDKDNPAAARLRYDTGAGRLRQDFKFAKQRVFENYFEGEQAGYEPLTKDIGDLLGIYSQSFGRTLNARGFVKSLMDIKAADGRPMVGTGGWARTVENDAGKVRKGVFVRANGLGSPEEFGDYMPINHTAFKNWKGVGVENGVRIFVLGDMKVHPDHYVQLKNVLEASSLNDKNMITKTFDNLLKAQAVIKETMLALPFFHYVQEGTHALGHEKNPFGKVKGFNPDNPVHIDLVTHGLQLDTYDAMAKFSEGLSMGSLAKKIPVIGKKILGPVTEHLFKDYIPALKLKTAEMMLQRNLERYKDEIVKHDEIKIKLDKTIDEINTVNRVFEKNTKELRKDLKFKESDTGKFLSGYQAEDRLNFDDYTNKINKIKKQIKEFEKSRDLALKPLNEKFESLSTEIKKYAGQDQLIELSAKHANSAYGELNYEWLGRSKGIQRALRAVLLAPDFLEARMKFVGQAVKPYGRDQLRALLILGVGQYIVSRAINKWLDDDYHFDKPFSMIIKGREIHFRSVPADLWEMYHDPRLFVFNRISPLIGRIGIEGLTRRDYSGASVDFYDTLKDAALNIIPMGIRSTGDQTIYDSMLSSIGLKTRKAVPELQRAIVNEYYKQNPKRRTGDDIERGKFSKELRELIAAAPGDTEAINAKIIEGLEKNLINPNAIDKIVDSKDKQLNNAEYLFQRLDKPAQQKFIKQMGENELRIYLPYVKSELLPEVIKLNPKAEEVMQSDPTLDIDLNVKSINYQQEALENEAELYQKPDGSFKTEDPRYKEIQKEYTALDLKLKEIYASKYWQNKKLNKRIGTKKTGIDNKKLKGSLIIPPSTKK